MFIIDVFLDLIETLHHFFDSITQPLNIEL